MSIAEKIGCAGETLRNWVRQAERPVALFWEWLLRSGAATYTEGIRVRPADCKISEEDEHGTVRVHLVGSKGSARPRDVYLRTEFVNRLLERARDAKIGPGRQIFPFQESAGRRAWRDVLDFIAERDPELSAQLGDPNPYDLRHTFARTLLTAASISTT